jgi:hypothetical protein
MGDGVVTDRRVFSPTGTVGLRGRGLSPRWTFVSDGRVSLGDGELLVVLVVFVLVVARGG